MTLPPLLTAYPYVPDYADDVLELPSDHDLSIRPGAIVLDLTALRPLYVRVLRVFSDDTLEVCMEYAPQVTWRLSVEEVAITLCQESAELETN